VEKEKRKMKPQTIKNKTEEMAKAINGTFHMSAKGVPHVIVKVKNTVYSLCWFNKIKKWRLFFPYGDKSIAQTRFDFDTNNIIRFFMPDN